MLAAMHFAELTPAEQRVLGCLIEKRWTTPDQYPLSLNGLRLACNQSTNRDPVTSYDETTVREAAQRLSLYGLARLASGHGSRATKYRHLAEEALGLGDHSLRGHQVGVLEGSETFPALRPRSIGRIEERDQRPGINQNDVHGTFFAGRLHRDAPGRPLRSRDRSPARPPGPPGPHPLAPPRHGRTPRPLGARSWIG